jgi:energy-coupling factor transporter ATP-binding protein EcfA2
MKLIYLYVKKFKLFSNKSFSLDSEYSVHYDIESGHLKVSRQSGLQDDFWHVGTTSIKTSIVESVSAIIGENGSGKTTFAQILLELFRASKTRGLDCIAVFKIRGQIVVYHSPELTVSIDTDQTNVKVKTNDSFLPVLSGIKYCYYSPVYTTSRDRGLELWDDGDTCYDLSTTGILKSCALEMNDRGGDVFTAFDIAEKRRVLEFLSLVENIRRHKPEITLGFPIRYPVAVWLEIEELAVHHARETLRNKREMLHGTEGAHSESVKRVEERTLSVLERVLALAETFSNPDFFIRAFMSYGFLHLYDLNLTQYVALGGAEDIELLDFLESISASSETPTTIRRQIFTYLENNPPMRTRNGRIVDDKLGQTVLKTFRCLQSLLATSGVTDHNGMIILPLDKPEIHRKLLDLVTLHGESSIFSKFLRFSFPSSISSGEMTFLSMFGRLYNQFSRFDLGPGPQSGNTEALVFFDEAETTLHPSFQRKLVYNAIWFFETFFPRAKVHLVFASHSPILLSDIPKCNCEFLVRENDVGTERSKSDLERLRNTFGANIFDLYRLSFFMEDGTVGRFASAKIDPVLAKLEKAIPRIQHRLDFKNKSLTNNDFEEINEIKALIGDCVLLRYIDGALAAIRGKEPKELGRDSRRD